MIRAYLDKISFRYKSYPRIVKQMGFGFGFMILGVVLSRYDPNVIYFIFAGIFCLLGLVLFVMGIINGFVDLFNHFLHKPKIPSSKDSNI